MPAGVSSLKVKQRGLVVSCLIFALSALVMLVIYSVETVIDGTMRSEPDYIGDPAWVPYQLGSEHARLLLASETGADADTLRLRGDIYLSFADRLRNAPPLKSEDEGLRTQFTLLEKAVRSTDILLDDTDTPEGREALRKQLRDDALFVGDFTLSLSKLYRKQTEAERASREHALQSYFRVLQLLHFLLLVFTLIAAWLAWRLIRAGRDREKQNAIQSRILTAVEEGIVGVGRDGSILFGNSRASELLGCKIEAGTRFPEVMLGTSELSAKVHSLIGIYSGQGSALSPFTETVSTGEGNSCRHFLLSMSPDHHAREGMDIDGSTIITIRDVTSEKEAARQSAEYEDCMAEASRVISYAVITGGLVHEISQPLAALRNYVHLLKTSPDFDFATASHRMIVGHMGEEANRVSEIIRHVRLMGPQEARLDGDCCLSEAISQSVRLLTLGMHPPPAIKIRKVDEEALHVRGSLPLLGQVIVNLLRNALQASAAAGKAGAVVVLRRSGGFAEIAVADFGEGVRPEAAGRLFEPFVRSNTGGMGLGLAICNRIASNLGGSISWENRFSGGAVFTFHVPLFKKG